MKRGKQEAESIPTIDSIEPTVLFVRTARGLEQALDVTISNKGRAVKAKLVMSFGPRQVEADLGTIEPGKSTKRIYVPDAREPMKVRFWLVADGRARRSQTAIWKPQRHWQVHVVHSSHHDLGYTDLPSNVLREHCAFMDDILRFCDQTADWPDESRFRYQVEQAWSLLHYIEHRPTEVVNRLVQLAREGRIEVNAFLGNETSELCGHEEQIRLLYPAFRLKRRFGIPIRTAELNDVPGLSWGLVSVLAGAGIRYFAPVLPDYFTWRFKVHSFWDEKAVIPRRMDGAFWWEGPDGSRVLFWHGGRAIPWSSFEQAEGDLPRELALLADQGYPFEVVRYGFVGAHRDNAPPDVRLSLIAREWNSRFAYPQVIVSTNSRFFERLEREAGEGLRVLRGDLPNTDYTVGAASTAKETGANRLAHDLLPAAEKFATAAAMVVSDYSYPSEALAEAYDCNLLYDEHTWGLFSPVGPYQDAHWNQKSEFALRAAAIGHDVVAKSTNRIADMIALPEEGHYVVVFNPLSWKRTDVVSLPAADPAPGGLLLSWRIPEPREGRAPALMYMYSTAIGRNILHPPLSLLEGPFELQDTETGRSIPYQLALLDDPRAPRHLAISRHAMGQIDSAHLRELVFVAEDVPPLGYRTYRIVPAKEKPSFDTSLRAGKYFLENRFFKVRVDPVSGTVKSILDKELGREWVDDKAGFGFNQLVTRSPKDGKAVAPSRSDIANGERGPVFASLLVRGEGVGCPQRTQEITLYDSLKRIDFANRLLRDASSPLEAYFAFPFAAKRPTFRYEATNSAVEPIRDQLPGSNTDAYSMQHYVAMWDKEAAIAWTSLEAPIMEVGGLWPGYVSQAHHGVTPPGFGHKFLKDPSQLKKGHIYSYAMASNFRTNFQPFQVADALFRYSMTSYKESGRREDARDFGWSLANPLVPVCVRGTREGSLPRSASFCNVDGSNALLLTMKAAEDGDGIILRLAETEGRDTDVTVRLPLFDISQACATNLVEENEGTLRYDRHRVTLRLRANGIATVRCRGSRRWPEVKLLARY